MIRFFFDLFSYLLNFRSYPIFRFIGKQNDKLITAYQT